MITTILVSLISLCSFSLFSSSIKYSKINNCFEYIDKGVFETSLVYVDLDGNPIYPYFNKEKLNTNVANYFDENLKGFEISYEYSLIYLTEEGNISLVNENYKVKVSLKSQTGVFTKFEKAKIYSIIEGEICEKS